ncbi:response regulator [Anaerotignum lactatifermentans]|uniref:Stage 0 sporulation protein A homolog n=1 Tax=Anaerotignum lactatifermentans TaxID=160404 RepID=A0ABS2G873_9FIRM|nr:helix-turn-helix domain-containing protein [Anaerotignum lactatifermentans]MBM6828864.1 response regulator [Anaerotignum lactatifermentans]MBM6876963.1 response regulator [Anaerotignum lactatifermentans]MBM6950521.1 response regulator [Anaerotignum lactatifermentans]
MTRTIIVDDEPAVAKMIQYFIDKENLPLDVVGIAYNGQQAIELIDKTAPKIVFLDIQMPVKNGFEVMKERPNQQYIIITAYESFRYAQQALRLGAKDIILKPVEYRQLETAVVNLLGWHITNNDTVNDILEYVHGNYAEKIELNKLAEHFFIAPSHLARLFKKHTGSSLITYINKVRIQKACALLDAGVSVKEAAEQTGYESLNNFYKYFKLYEGMTPAAYCKAQKPVFPEKEAQKEKEEPPTI